MQKMTVSLNWLNLANLNVTLLAKEAQGYQCTLAARQPCANKGLLYVK